MGDYIQVITTVSKETDAKKLAALVLENQLGACVQISECNSFYRWQGNVENEKELRLTIKTRLECYSELEGILLDAHPYETPEIVALPINQGYAGYLRWIDEEVPLTQ